MSTESAEYPMKWHKFLIYFSLWFSALVSLGLSLRYFMGGQYGENASLVYLAFPRLKYLEISMGVIYLALAGYIIYVRFQLAGFKTNAPVKLLAIYVISFAVSFIYILGASAVTGIKTSSITTGSSIWSDIVSSAVFMWVNKTYYDKRMDLFIN